MAWASRARLVPPSTAQVASPVTATLADGRRADASCPARPAAATGARQTATMVIPRPRRSAQSAASARDAAAPNAATGCPRRGSASTASRAAPSSSPAARPRRDGIISETFPGHRLPALPSTERKTGDHSPRYPSTCVPPPTWAPSARLTQGARFWAGWFG